jgi:hypothetical protein
MVAAVAAPALIDATPIIAAKEGAAPIKLSIILGVKLENFLAKEA